jgi:capsular polysaccharide biosynthesis protein
MVRVASLGTVVLTAVYSLFIIKTTYISERNAADRSPLGAQSDKLDRLADTFQIIVKDRRDLPEDKRELQKNVNRKILHKKVRLWKSGVF